MDRRTFILALATGLYSRLVRAQSHRPRVGFLNNGSYSSYRGLLQAFHGGLAQAGFVEGNNVDVDYRWADGNDARLPVLVKDLRAVDVIVAAGGTAAVLAVKSAGLQNPTVFVIGGDPVKFGLVQSLNHPGGTMTGASFLANSLLSKQVEIVHELIPKGGRIGFLVNPSNPNAKFDEREVLAASSQLGHEVSTEQVVNTADVGPAAARLLEAGASALLIAPDAMFTSERQTLISIGRDRKIPTVYNSREFAEAGGLVGYGAKQSEAYKTAGIYVGRILQGQKPADLPVAQSSIIELVVNLGTAKSLGIVFSQAILSRADDLVE